MKRIIQIIVLLLIVGGIYFFANSVNAPKSDDVLSQQDPESPAQLCFYYENSSQSGFRDREWLKLNITGDKVDGEYQYLPAEKDSKTGTFQGTVGAVVPTEMARHIDALWNVSAEAMITTEELKITFGEGTANVGFGEMKDRGDGVYGYANPENITYGNPMTDVGCNDLDDWILVEKYVRENIAKLVVDEPVLGGSWYVTSVHIDPLSKSGTMEFEDGHINGSANFAYIRNGDEVQVEVN